jgi:hypothetical protein
MIIEQTPQNNPVSPKAKIPTGSACTTAPNIAKHEKTMLTNARNLLFFILPSP